MPVLGDNQKKKQKAPLVNEIIARVNDNTKRLRLLEERERLLTSRISSMDESVVMKIQEMDGYTKQLDERLGMQQGQAETLQNTLKEVVKQLKFLATKAQVKKVEETMKILEPVLAELVATTQANSSKQVTFK